jgi:hypothetical protein
MRDGQTTTSLEQVPRELRTHRKSPIALTLIILIVILFGGFWLYQDRMATVPIEPEPAVVTPPVTSQPTPSPQPSPSVSDMQEAAVNIAIPDYSSQF